MMTIATMMMHTFFQVGIMTDTVIVILCDTDRLKDTDKSMSVHCNLV